MKRGSPNAHRARLTEKKQGRRITEEDLTNLGAWVDYAYHRNFQRLSIKPELAAVISLLLEERGK